MSPSELFAHPEGLPLLLLAPCVYLAWWALDRARARRLARLVGPRAPELAEGARPGARAVRRALFATGILFATIAGLGPRIGEAEGDAEWQGVDLVVGLDVSRSMLARDVPPSRLERAKQEIRALADRAEGDRLGLIVFAGDARLRVPLTPDRDSFARLAAEHANPAGARRGGTDLGAALEAALDALEGGDAERPGAIVLLTDGEDLEGRGLSVADRCRERGVAVHGIGFGTIRGGKIALDGEDGEAYLRDGSGGDVVSVMDAAGLRRIADATGGAFVAAQEARHPLVELYEDQVLPQARLAFASTDPTRSGRGNRFQWFLLVAFGLWLVDLGWVMRLRSRVAPAGLGLLLLLAACDATASGREAWREGRPEAARALFREAVEASGDDASPELLHDLALAALRAGDWAEAEAAARKAAERGGERFAGLDAFVRGSRAFARSHEAEAETRAPDADPRALMPVLRFAEDALAGWQWAAASRPDWPEARRNVERGLLWLEGLRERRTEGTKKPKAPDGPPPPPPPPPPPVGPEAEDATPVERPELETTELSPREILGLFVVLRQKEIQKRALRSARRHARAAEVERDW